MLCVLGVDTEAGDMCDSDENRPSRRKTEEPAVGARKRRKREDLSGLTAEEKLARLNRMNNDRVSRWRAREAEKKAAAELDEGDADKEKQQCARCCVKGQKKGIGKNGNGSKRMREQGDDNEGQGERYV